jgi:HD-like signal output (HDOD) protein
MPKEQVFETLWARMAERGDFPTLQRSVHDIVGAMQEEDSTTAEMAEAVLADFALTQKVLRLANSPMYASFGGEVSTISHAIMVLGAETIGYLALGLQLIDSFSGLVAGTEEAARELAQAQLAAEFARHATAARGGKESESAVVSALMHPLARLLVVFYFPEAWDEIAGLSDDWIQSESEACAQVLGVSFTEIAEEVSKRWGLPQAIAASMHPKPLDPELPPLTYTDWLGAVAQLASQAASLSVNGRPQEEVEHLAFTFTNALGLDLESMRKGCQSMAKLKRQLDSVTAGATTKERRKKVDKVEDTQSKLQNGLNKVRGAAQGYSVAEVMPLVLEVMMQAMGYAHCIAFLLYPAHKKFLARVGFGPGVREILPQLGFDEAFVPDVFHLACTQKKTIYIEDAHEPHIVQRLPAWYRSHFPDAKSFLLVPVQLRGRCIALLYGDWSGDNATPRGPNDKERETLDLLADEIARSFERQALAARSGG